MKRIRVRKGEIIQTKGALNSKIFIVESGLLRSYTVDEKGKEHIFMFAPEGWTVADSKGPDQPTDLYIDVLEDATLEVHEKVEGEMPPDPKPLLKRIAVLQQRVIMMMSASAIERYDHFMETYADIAQRVPQKMIASFLGITPEALSKVKHERLKAEQ